MSEKDTDIKEALNEIKDRVDSQDIKDAIAEKIEKVNDSIVQK